MKPLVQQLTDIATFLGAIQASLRVLSTDELEIIRGHIQEELSLSPCEDSDDQIMRWLRFIDVEIWREIFYRDPNDY